MKVSLTFKELANYRNSDGAIELDHFISKLPTEREVRGNENREKQWFDINDGRVMFKSNEDEHTFAHYSELICCELAKQAGLKTAEYDLATFQGEQGVITKHICKPKEELLTIHELIGVDPTINEEFPDSVDIVWVFEELENKMRKDGYKEEDIDECLLGLRKQLLFDIYVMETDRHTENVSFVVNKDEENDKQSIRISPIYDTENALVLYNDPETMRKIYGNLLKTSEVISIQEPKMCVIPEEPDEQPEEETKSEFLDFFQKLRADVNEGARFSTRSEELWKTTLDFLCEDDRVYDFIENNLEKMNIEEAIDSVEQKIGTTIDEDVKKMAMACFDERKAAIEFEMGLDICIPKSEKKEDRELT